MLNYNSYTSPGMDELSHMECVLGHKVKIYSAVEVIPEGVVTGAVKNYHFTQKNQLAYLRKHL